MGDIRKKTNELIRRRKKKRLIRRSIFFLVLAIIALTVFCLKHPYFNISEIQVVNNKLVSEEKLLELSNITLDSNIFYLNKKEARTKILSNSYISEVSIKRRYPSTVILDIVERIPQYYAVRDKEYLILDTKGRIIDIIESVEGKELIPLLGVNPLTESLGNMISSDSKIQKQLEVFSDLIKRNLSEVKITSMDLENSTDLKVYFNNIMVKVGNINDMQLKLDKAINIITQQNIKDSKGYIDVSFNGAPVIAIEE